MPEARTSGAPRFATLGPAGSNHAFVVARYLAFHGLDDAPVQLFTSFDDAAQSVLRGENDFLVQCAVHPATPRTVALFHRGLHVVDTFISSSRPLAVLRRRDRPSPQTVGAMTATVEYTELSRWGRMVELDTVAAVVDELIDGSLDAGLGFADAAREHADMLIVEEDVTSPDDAWIVYGRQRAAQGNIVSSHSGWLRALYTTP